MLEDFDFLIGQWKVINNRLKSWMCDCHEWIQFESQHTEKKHSLGSGNFAVHQYVFNHALYERSVLRKFNDTYQFWEINRIDQMSSLALQSLKGTFWKNKGSFISRGLLDEQEVLVWAEWTKVNSNFAYWEQSVSNDNGATWELNWIMDFKRIR